MLELKRLKKECLKEIYELNIKYNKNYHFPKQKELFYNNNDIYNHSFGIFKDNVLQEYIIAFYNKEEDIIEIENFIWKNSKAYILLLTAFFKECPEPKYSLFICDKGFNILEKILKKHFNDSYQICSKTKEDRYGETLNHVYIRIRRIKN